MLANAKQFSTAAANATPNDDGIAISDAEFEQWRRLIHTATGIHLSELKKPLICGRLAKRLKARQLRSYGEYFQLISSPKEEQERQLALELITTNETYFFREPRHFDFLRERILVKPTGPTPFRVWSAACSTGEEPYSIAMLLAATLGERGWEILASDFNTTVLQQARLGHYPLSRGQDIPQPYLKSYCLRGVGQHQGTFLVERHLRQHVQFTPINLNEPLPNIGRFDVIFLRNVLIYFDQDTKRRIIERVGAQLNPGGWLFVGHSESLNGISSRFATVQPAVYKLISP